jgi:hypothetical protein
MKQHDVVLVGRIDSLGRLKVPMDEMRAFTAMHPDKRVILTMKVYEPGTSAALRGYYYNYIVKAMTDGYWENGERLTYEQTEERLRELSPITHHHAVDEVTGTIKGFLRRISDLDNSELIEHIEIIRQYAAENLCVYIADPKTI